LYGNATSRIRRNTFEARFDDAYRRFLETWSGFARFQTGQWRSLAEASVQARQLAKFRTNLNLAQFLSDSSGVSLKVPGTASGYCAQADCLFHRLRRHHSDMVIVARVVREGFLSRAMKLRFHMDHCRVKLPACSSTCRICGPLPLARRRNNSIHPQMLHHLAEGRRRQPRIQ
jgi:hypothetical protein